MSDYTVRRMTVRKRMRKKLQEIKQQLPRRMHDRVPQTGEWHRSVLQGYYNYYAVPGNLNTLGLFRDQALRLWGKQSVGEVKRAGSLGLAALRLPIDGFLVLRSSIHIPKSVLPPIIQDRSRMRSSAPVRICAGVSGN
jgi:RNA-directed DNA polymerase